MSKKMQKLLETLIKLLQGMVTKDVPVEQVETKKAPSKGKAVLGITVIGLIGGMVAQFEGLRTDPYRDVVGVMTVCYGHTGNVENRKYSQDECDYLLNKDIQRFADKVEQCQPNLPIEVKAAFTSASFNLGSRIVCNTKTSTAARLLKAGDYKGACEQLPRWNKARVNGKLTALRGLTKRRNKETELCLKGVK